MVATEPCFEAADFDFLPELDLPEFHADFDATDQFNQLLDGKVVFMQNQEGKRAALGDCNADAPPTLATLQSSEDRLVTADFVVQAERNHRKCELNRAAQKRFRQRKKASAPRFFR